MRIFLLATFLILSSLKVFSQQFSQYNTGTLYESFENPAQRAFIPDSSRKYAFNMFVPNFTGNIYLKGNTQATLKRRVFDGLYNNSQLKIGEGRYNRINSGVNTYLIMFKVFTDLHSNSEIGFSLQTRLESKGYFTDESAALFNGNNAFDKDIYENKFNDKIQFQTYHQASFTYRENLSKKFALGVKLSALLGIQYQKLTINQSSVNFDKLNDNAILDLTGKYYINYTPGGFGASDLLPTLRNPGASISIGTSLRTRDNINLQGNIKDLGFIHWSNRSAIYTFSDSSLIIDQSSRDRENNAYKAIYKIIHTGGATGSFTTPTNAKIEFSANKTYWLDYGKIFKYSPTLVASKELFYNGLVVAMVNPVQYKNVTLSLTPAYDNYRIFSLGGQFMIKSPNTEFFIGSESLIPSGRFLMAGLGSDTQTNRNGAYTAADIYLGFSLKFGSVIEHPMNASYIPLGEEKGFIGRLWDRIFKKGG